MPASANATKLANLIDPQVLADEIDKKLINGIRFAPLARVDYTLVGRPGDTVTLPSYNYITAASAVAEGADIPIKQLTTSSTPVQVSKIGSVVEYTDEALLCGNANSVAEEAAKQVVMSIADKVEIDWLSAMSTGATLTQAIANATMIADYASALGKFGEDMDGAKVLVVSPAQYVKLMQSSGWVPNTEVGANILVSGSVGKFLGMDVVISNRLTAAANEVGYIVKPGALALFMKRDTLVEFDRDIICETNYIKASKICAEYVYDATKLVKLTF